MDISHKPEAETAIGYHGACQVTDDEVRQFCDELRQAQRAEAEEIWRDFDAAVPGVVLSYQSDKKATG